MLISPCVIWKKEKKNVKKKKKKKNLSIYKVANI